ncbi:MAG: hypothetical protein O3A01_08990 [bacterium]|nr:hypothetical protein [bacterium]
MLQAVEYFQRGDYLNAIARCEEILALEPTHAEAKHFVSGLHHMCAINATQEKEYELALTHLKMANKYAPDDNKIKSDLASAYCNVGHELNTKGSPKEAIPFLEKAIEIEPSLTAYKNLAYALEKSRQARVARDILELLVSKYPLEIEAHLTLAVLAQKQGDTARAKSALEAAYELEPTGAHDILRKTLAPAYFDSVEQMHQSRALLERNLDDLLAQNYVLKDPLNEVGIRNFYWAYQGLNDKSIMVKTAQLFMNQSAIRYTAKRPQKRDNDSKIRIGFFCNMFYDQSVSHFYANMIATLPDDFHVSIFYPTPKHRDHITEMIKARSDFYCEPDTDMESCRSAIESQALDILIYPEIGMEPLTYFLAFSRLAPVQCVLMGHPITTGIPTIDYYLGSEVFTPIQYTRHANEFSEEYIRLAGMPVCYSLPDTHVTPKTRADLGLPEDCNIYTYPMTLFKLNPAFDDVIQGILDGDKNGVVLLFKYDALEDKIKARFERKFPHLMERIVWCHPLGRMDFITLLEHSNVVLESFPFGGGNTSLLAIAAGTPIMTLETAFLRGRFTSGYYRYMGMEELISTSVDGYIQLALKIGMNPEIRSAYSDQLRDRSSVLFENTEGVNAMIEWYRSIV